MSIPASVITAYILFSLLNISYELANPFGYGCNDLDLDRMCRSIAVDMDLIASYPTSPNPGDWLFTGENDSLWPLVSDVSLAHPDKLQLKTVKEALEERMKTVMYYWQLGLKMCQDKLKGN
jgi:hypothetical protein